MELISVLTLLTLAGLGAESHTLTNARNKVSTRIHVNGTRGKSTTVRLVAAICRAYGRKTVAKVTGGNPAFIDTSGMQHEWKRMGHARLSEQHRFWRIAAGNGADAAVLECMAVDPYLQWVAEQRITQATHAVITNVRPDHFESMGCNLEEIARSLANTVPYGGKLILGDSAFAGLFTQVANERGSTVTVVTEADRQELYVKLGKKLGWSAAFLENATTALVTARTLGMPQSVVEDVLCGWQMPQPLYEVDWEGKPVYVINALSANDPVSAAAAWDHLPLGSTGIALYAHRGDRPLRLKSFLDALALEPRCEEMLIAGPIARHHVFLRGVQRADRASAGATHLSPPCIGAVGTPAVIARLTCIVRTSSSPLWLVLLGNELGMPHALQSLTTPARWPSNCSETDTLPSNAIEQEGNPA